MNTPPNGVIHYKNTWIEAFRAFVIFSVSFPYRFRIVSVSFPYRFRIILLSSSYCEAENNTETIRNRTNDERMRIGGTRVVHLTIIVNSYDNGKTQTNYWGGQHLLMTTKSDKLMQNMSRVLNPLPVMGEIGPRRIAVFISVANWGNENTETKNST